MFKNTFAKAATVATLSVAILGLMPLAVLADNPTPSISSISPVSVATGTGAFTLTVNGQNFIPGSVVNINGINRITTYLSPTQLTALMTAADTANSTSFNVTVFNAGPGGGTSNTVTLNVIGTTPTFSISSLSPASFTVGSGATTLTINGNGFMSGATVSVNGVPRTATFVSPNQLTIALNPSDLTTAGNSTIMVNNPSGGGTSNTLGFTINTNGTSSSTPSISSISPNSATVGSAGLTLTVNGSNFMSGSTVAFNGLTRPTTFVSPTQLTATIYASDLGLSGPEAVTVTNPAPGGGMSNAVMFTVNGLTGTTTGTTGTVNTPRLPNTGFGPDEQDGINRLLIDGALAVLAAFTIVGSLAVASFMRKARS
jgi:hypothetical protein